jgi:cellulose synthase/poly-beta-1,6-N-acetylglucosamine synthase-like glycosyltransferase
VSIYAQGVRLGTPSGVEVDRFAAPSHRGERDNNGNYGSSIVPAQYASPSRQETIRVSVLLPCLNEEASIAEVVADFRAALPQATIFVYDNASTDRTAEVAREAGAIVRSVPERGKGNEPFRVTGVTLCELAW